MDRLLTKSLINILVDLPDNADVVAAHDVEPKNNLGRNFDMKRHNNKYSNCILIVLPSYPFLEP